MAAQSLLLSDDTVIVFAQALTGLGHLRVTHALYHGMPEGTHATLLSSQDETINYMHRLTSINPAFRRIMEVTQYGWMEDVFTLFARQYFRENAALVARQLQTILDQRIVHPKRLVLVATHANLAHQLAALKDGFARKNDIAISLVVVVTDDSPQHMWAVGAADWVIVPSEHTKKALMAYHQTQQMPPARYMVLPYMVSPLLSTKMTPSQFRRRQREMHPLAQIPFHVSVPISGAAVQLEYFQKLIGYLQAASSRYLFHIVSHQSFTTEPFLSRMRTAPGVTVSVSKSHRDVVELYEALYAKETIALEITKPSEQAFKVLLTPKMRGGAVLAFSHPVGRQEYDNLAFLRRHDLIPTVPQQARLWQQAAASEKPDDALVDKATRWRGLLLPVHSLDSAKFIHWCLMEGIFTRMGAFAHHEEHAEIASDGVARFWAAMDTLLAQ